MTLIDADIQYHENTTVIHLTEEQAIKLVAAIEENMKKVTKGVFKGVELLTIPKLAEHKIRVGLWRE